jgi:hypothetical protein
MILELTNQIDLNSKLHCAIHERRFNVQWNLIALLIAPICLERRAVIVLESANLALE